MKNTIIKWAESHDWCFKANQKVETGELIITLSSHAIADNDGKSIITFKSLKELKNWAGY